MSVTYYLDNTRAGRNMDPQRPSMGHIQMVDDGRVYTGLGVKDLRRRLDYWEGRVADFAASSATAEGKAKAEAKRLLKSGEKLINTIRDQIAEREAA